MGLPHFHSFLPLTIYLLKNPNLLFPVVQFSCCPFSILPTNRQPDPEPGLGWRTHRAAGLQKTRICSCLFPYLSSWAPKNKCFWTVVLEKTLESPLDCKEINPVNPKGNQSWIFIGRTDAEAETPILWLPDVKNWLIGIDPDARQDWRQEEKEMKEEMVVWRHQLNGHEFE